MCCKFALFLITNVALAQFTNLATTDDGGQFYFSSAFRQKSTEQPTHEKIFRYTDGHIHLFAQQDQEPGQPPQSFVSGSFHELIAPDVSGDGRFVSYTGRRICMGGSECLDVASYAPQLRRDGASVPLPPGDGYIQLSRNGRYAVLFRSGRVSVRNSTLIDLTTQEQQPIPFTDLSTRQAIASDGRVIWSNRLWSRGEVRTLAFTERSFRTILNDQATMAAYVAEDVNISVRASLRTFDLRSGRDVRIDAVTLPALMALSNDGAQLLYVAADRVILASTDGVTRTTLIEVSDGVADLTLSGNGNVAYVSTSGGRLLRIDTASRATEDLTGSTPAFNGAYAMFVPGSLVFIRGAGLNSPGVTVRFGAAQLPVVGTDLEGLFVQVPWELPPTTARLTLSTENSLFEHVTGPITIVPYGPATAVHRPAPNGLSEPAIVNTEFTARITARNPARAGDVIHLFATGLGPVTTPVRTGELSPADPPARLLTPIHCGLGSSEIVTQPADVLFAGLAPALVGLYQISIRLPQTVPAETPVAVQLLCDQSAPSGQRFRFGGLIWLTREPPR